MKFFNTPTMTDYNEIVGLELGAKSRNVACRNEKKGSVTTAAMDNLKTQAITANFEKVVVIAARGDHMETADIAVRYSSIRSKRMFTTRLDMIRGLGSILTAAHAGRLSFSDARIHPHTLFGISAVDSGSLAHLIMPCNGEPINSLVKCTNKTEGAI